MGNTSTFLRSLSLSFLFPFHQYTLSTPSLFENGKATQQTPYKTESKQEGSSSGNPYTTTFYSSHAYD